MKKKNITLATLAAGVCLLCCLSATAQNLISNGDFGSGDLTGWITTPTAPTTITYDGTEGNPIGSALLARNDATAAANGNYIYQVVSVTPGKQYKFDADWKGDLLNGGTGRNWAEVFISFASSPSATPANIVYKKATDGGPNDVPMPWDWESVLLSPDGGPTNGIFTATDNYMVVGFNLGGRAGVGPGYYNLDNVSVTPYPPISVPVFTNIMRAGANIILRGRDGPSQGVYQVLRSTSMTQPLDSWQDIGIDTFDLNGNFSFTNTLPVDAAGFYRLLVVSLTSAPQITAQPQDRAAIVGQDVDFTVTAVGALPLHYQWYHNTNTVLMGQTNATLTLNDVQLTNEGMYSVMVTNVFGSTNSTFAALTVSTNTGPIGFATLSGGTTGGAGGSTVTVSDSSALKDALRSSGPTIVQVSGNISIGVIVIQNQSDKTIVGLDGNSGWTGNIQFKGCTNFIVQHLNIKSPSTGDGITIQDHSENFWVDHCSLDDCSDGQIDITHGSSYITVSWCKFHYTDQVDHCFTSLVGHADDNGAEDSGRLFITYHHNFWTTGCDERMPMVRFGRVHMFNNYYYIPGHLGSCIKAKIGAEILVENNYFENCRAPYQAEDGGKLKATGNVMVDTYGPLTGGSDTVFTPSYAYTLEDPATARAGILAGAGNTF